MRLILKKLPAYDSTTYRFLFAENSAARPLEFRLSADPTGLQRFLTGKLDIDDKTAARIVRDVESPGGTASLDQLYLSGVPMTQPELTLLLRQFDESKRVPGNTVVQEHAV